MRLLLVIGALAMGAVACARQDESRSVNTAAATSTTTTATTTTPMPADVIRVDIAGGCPATVAGHPRSSSTAAGWIWNPDPTDLDRVFVPGAPTSAIVCRYSPLITPMDPSKSSIESGGELADERQLERAEAVELASLANDIEPSDIASTCLISTMETATYTAVAFAVPGRADVDVWLKDWIGCPELSNGVRFSGELINGLGSAFLDELNRLAV